MNKYNYTRRYYDKDHSIDKKNKLIAVLVLTVITLLFILNHFYYENSSLNKEIEGLNYEILEKESEINKIKTFVDSIKPKQTNIKVIEKPKYFNKKIKKDTLKITTKTISEPVVKMISDSL